MFDIGGWEFLIVIVIAIIVIGPKDLPGAIRSVTGWIRRARELAREFQSGIDDLAREADMDTVKNDIQAGLGLEDLTDSGNTIRNQIENSIDPGGEIKKAFEENPAAVDDGMDDNGPFADNSFEEDDDIDGEILDGEESLEDGSSSTGRAAETASSDVQDDALDQDIVNAIPEADVENTVTEPPTKKTES